MIEELPGLEKLSQREVQVLEIMLRTRDHSTFKNRSLSKLEESILQKTGATSLEKLVQQLHINLTGVKKERDIDRKIIDEFLHDRRFQRFQTFATQAIRILDNATQQYLYVNEASETMIGWKAEEIMKGGLRFGHQKTHPWDLLQLLVITKKVMKVYGALSEEDKLNSRYSFDLRIKHKDGGYRRILQHIFPLDLTKEGKPRLHVIISNDITELKTSTRMHYVFGVNRNNIFHRLIEGKSGSATSMLSERETEILDLTAQGRTAREIAGELHISEETVKTHRKNMLKKTGRKNPSELIRHAIVHGWI